MRVQLLKYWDRMHSSFWFVPSIMAGAAVGLVFATVSVDERMADRWWKSLDWAISSSPEGASAVLGVIAGSMMTIAGVVFSMILVALTLASSQFGPRLLRNFMNDMANQVVLGTFVATFLYCLLVLRTIRHSYDDPFVPHLSVTLGVLFALMSMGVLIYFIHHVSVSIQADEIISRVSKELLDGIERQYPQHIGQGDPEIASAPPAAALPASFEKEARPVASLGDGYIQFINADTLMQVAVENNLLLKVEQRPGHYATAGSTLMQVWPGGRITDQLVTQINETIVLGRQRTPLQDVEFSLNQLVEIALRALSPSVNDPFTAIRCVDRLGSALCRLASRVTPSPYRHDQEQRLRVIAVPVGFPALVEAAFNQIRQAARSNAAVTIRLLETIAVIAGCVRRPEDRRALRVQTEIIARQARAALPEVVDRRCVEERLKAAQRVLNHHQGLSQDQPGA